MRCASKRQFLQSVGGIVGASALLSFASLEQAIAQVATLAPATLAQDDQFWRSIRKRFTPASDFIQLENGYYSLAADPVLDAYVGHVRRINKLSSFYMRGRQADDMLAVRAHLARLLGCSQDELIVTRNTTESLDSVIAGFDWKAGDEAVMAEQDYGSMLDMFKLQARRHGMRNNIVSLPLHPQGDDEIVELYSNAITPKTRLLMICHMVNITGQILPVRKIVDVAHAKGVPVMVDGAHTFGQLDFRIGDLDCDYYGSSLHKWLGAPLGVGLLYVRRERIKALWPMFGDASFADDDIRKLNHSGTRPVATDLAIIDAIRFHESIGIERKSARLRYLQRYWTDRVRGGKRIVLHTPEQPQRSCAIANVGIEGIAPAQLAKTLLDKYRIFTVAIDGAGVHGVRVTPQLFTTTAELDTLVKALREIAATTT